MHGYCGILILAGLIILLLAIVGKHTAAVTVTDRGLHFLAHHSRVKRAVTADSNRLWPNATVPYKFSPSLPDELRTFILDAIAHWQNRTCIRFVEKERHMVDFVVFTSESCGCCSTVGRNGGRQSLSLKDYCASPGVAIHEIGHLLGFYHEHTRPDRDRVIKVLWSNILTDQYENYQQREALEIQSFGRPYDLHSIMHYSEMTFSNGKGPTMRRLDGKNIGKQAQVLSQEDILQARLLYNCPEPECSFNLNESSGVISSPMYPNRYLANMDCTWTINVPKDKQVILRFEGFHIQDSYKCSADYLRVHEQNSTGNLIGLFCGSGLPPPIKSKVTLWLEFHTDWILAKSGFMLHFEVKDLRAVDNLKLGSHVDSASYLSDTECVQISRSKHGTYKSAQIPTGQIMTDLTCSFILDASQSTVNRLQFSMSTNQSRAYGSDCMGRVFVPTDDNKYISVFETGNKNGTANNYMQNNERWQQIHYQCNGQENIELLLNNSLVFIQWNSQHHKSLTLHYWIDYDECRPPSPCDQSCENTITGYRCLCDNGYLLVDEHRCVAKLQAIQDYCHETVEAITGKLISTTEPTESCVYNIVRPGYKIHLTIVILRLPRSGDCSNNYVEVKSRKKLLANLCADINGLELSAGEELTITQYYNANTTTTLPFFIAEYSSFLKQEEICELSVSDGEFRSPGYPEGYDAHVNCEWKLSVPRSRRAQLTIIDMKIEYTDGCKYDRLEVYDGRNKKAPRIEILCGEISNHLIRATGSKMLIVFITDQSGSGRGFRALLTHTDRVTSTFETTRSDLSLSSTSSTTTSKTHVTKTENPTIDREITSANFDYLWDNW